MATKLTGTIKREIEIDGQPYTATLAPEGMTVVPKRGRVGRMVSWREVAAVSKGTHDVTANASKS